MDLNPKILTIEGKEELVVMTMADYRKLREAAEDLQDIMAMRTARKANRGKPTYTVQQVRDQLGMAGRSTNKKNAVRRPSR